MTELDRIPDWMQPDIPPSRQLDLKTWTQDFRDVYAVAEALCKTPFVPKEMLGNQAMTAAAIMKGRELGLNPFDALGSIYIVHGRVGYFAEFMRRRIIQAGHTLRIVENTDSRAVIEGTRREGGEPQRATFTAEQARKAGIDLGKYPADKLIARATSRLCRQVFPDVLSGTLIAEDIMDGLIPAEPDAKAAPAPKAALKRGRASKPAKAAATQPAPAPKPDDSDDIAELLGDEPDVSDGMAADKGGARTAANGTPPPSLALDDADDENSEEPLPLDVPAEDESDESLITAAQLKKLSILLRENGFDDRDTKHAFVSAAINRDIGSAKELTKTEASTVIDLLEGDEPADD